MYEKFLTEHSQFVCNLLPHTVDVVIADNFPVFSRGKSQLHPIDLENTRAIAHVRIHVERVIGLIRKKYRICSVIVPINSLAAPNIV